jgi:hypothetical protein
MVLGLLAMALVACSPALSPTARAPEEASVPRGGGGTQVNGQFTERLVVVDTGTASAEPEMDSVVFGVELQDDDPAAIVDEAAGKIDQATPHHGHWGSQRGTSGPLATTCGWRPSATLSKDPHR